MARILSVDDSKVIRELMKTILENQGHEVLVAEDGMTAMSLARKEKVDMVFSDINMPRMNGISLIGKLRTLPGYEKIPIIMLTTENGDFKKEKAREYGASGWLAKPLSEERVLNAVSRMIG
jgi:two-component system chemotaxis response regulator CheY